MGGVIHIITRQASQPLLAGSGSGWHSYQRREQLGRWPRSFGWCYGLEFKVGQSGVLTGGAHFRDAFDLDQRMRRPPGVR